MVKRVIKISILAICALAVIYLLFGRTLRRWITPLDTAVGRVGEDIVTLKDVNAMVDYTWIIINGSSRAAYESVISGEHIRDMNISTLDYCINSRLFLQKANEMGLYPLSEEDRAAAAAKAKLYYQENTVQFKLAGVSEEDLIRIETEEKVTKLLKEEVSKNITVTDAEAEAKYESLLADQKDRYTKSPSSYQTDRYEGRGTVFVYRPEEFRVVKHIMIPFSYDVARPIMEQTDEDEKKKMINENLPKIQKAAEEVLAQAQDEEDFDVIMMALRMIHRPFGSLWNNCYMDSEYELGDCIDFLPDLKEAAFALKNVGDKTGLVATEYGYHILMWVGSAPAGPAPFEEVKDAIKESLLETKKSAEWQEAVTQWRGAINIEKYPDRIP